MVSDKARFWPWFQVWHGLATYRRGHGFSFQAWHHTSHKDIVAIVLTGKKSITAVQYLPAFVSTCKYLQRIIVNIVLLSLSISISVVSVCTLSCFGNLSAHIHAPDGAAPKIDLCMCVCLWNLIHVALNSVSYC